MARKTSRRTTLSLVSAITVVGLVISATVMSAKGSNRGTLSPQTAEDAVDSATLTAASRTRIFFGHQSVGANIIDGLRGAYDAKAVAAPDIVEVSGGTTPQLPHGGFLAHAFLGVNGDPEGKIEAFDSLLRAGLADRVDVAMMKFCYIDITSATDVDALFAKYRSTLAALERDYPDVTFVHLTTPLTTPAGLKGRVKSWLGGGNPSAADNAARERLNALLRDTYRGEHLFDLAALESTAPDGSRMSGSSDGRPAYSLYPAYAVDEGHLTPTFAQLVASRLLATVTDAAV